MLLKKWTVVKNKIYFFAWSTEFGAMSN